MDASKSKEFNDSNFANNKKPTSLDYLPGYLKSYASAGFFRNELPTDVEDAGKAGLIVSVPVLIGVGLSSEQSRKYFRESIVFQLTGNNPRAGYSNSNGIGNVPIATSAVDLIGSDYSGIDSLYNLQVRLGNTIVVDSPTKFPLMIQGNEYASLYKPSFEIGEYHSAIYYWSAAYPWFFYEIKNTALRETLLDKELRSLTLFGQYRFSLSYDIYQYLNEEWGGILKVMN